MAYTTDSEAKFAAKERVYPPKSQARRQEDKPQICFPGRPGAAVISGIRNKVVSTLWSEESSSRDWKKKVAFLVFFGAGS